MADAATVANTSKESTGADGGRVDPARGGIAEARARACRETTRRPKWLYSFIRMS